jgi:TonB-linked SusC/RagA family outer membrane protein
LTAETALKNFTRFPDLVNSAEYAHLRNETRTNAGQDRQFTEQEIEYFRTGEKPLLYPDRNFVEEFTKNFARQQDYNLKISGGGNFARYFVNAGFVSQNSLIKTDENDPKSPWNEEMRLRRFSFRSNIDIDVNESLRARLNLAGNLGKQRSPVAQKGEPASSASGLILDDIIRLPPNLIPKDVTPEDAIPEGEVIFSPEAKGKPVYGAINRSGYNVANRNRIMATFGLKQEMDFITEGLSAEARLSFDTRNISTQSRQRDYASYQVVGETTANGQDSVAYRRIGQTENTPLGNNLFSTARKTTDLNISLNYEHTLGANHDVTGLLLYNQVRRTIDAELPFNHIGFVGRATYGYDNRYLAEFNFGYNGSEQFAPGRRFGLFPSFAVGWVPTQEEFLEDSDVLSYLKLRGSYGIVGNDRLGAERFLYLADYGKGGGSVGGLNNTIVESSLPNRNLTWERAHKYNLGVESEFFGSLGLDVDLFYERRNNILTRPNSVPTEFLGTTGIPPLNLGVIENKGLEATLSFSHSFNPEVHLQARVNGAFARNRYLEFDEPPLPEDYAYQRRREGFRIGERFGLKALGFFTSEEEIENHAEYQLGGTPPRVGDLKYKDANGDGLINQEDRVPIGNPKAPELTYGASFSLDYHQFDISFLLQGAGNQSQYLSGRGIWEVGAYNYTERHLKRFTKERYEAGKEILYPRLSYIQNSNHKYNSYWLRNSTFLRLKNAEIGYTLPSSLTSKIGSENIRIYVSGLNLLTWDMLPTDHYDPELADGAGNVHPLYRTYNFGARLTF